jgi:hypothetical protein
METVWMQPPDGGQPVEVAASSEALTPLMVMGYTQVNPPQTPTPTEGEPK